MRAQRPPPRLFARSGGSSGGGGREEKYFTSSASAGMASCAHEIFSFFSLVHFSFYRYFFLLFCVFSLGATRSFIAVRRGSFSYYCVFLRAQIRLTCYYNISIYAIYVRASVSADRYLRVITRFKTSEFVPYGTQWPTPTTFVLVAKSTKQKQKP